ncbi:MAG: hypothetical protein K9M45_12290 [Kiritimatiellales bacterium]|nr:hypothetical protein [Kiritimatiellales bacterium]
MDVGKFKASRKILQGWVVIPPLLIVLVGLGSYPIQRKAYWSLKRTKALHEILPMFVQIRRESTEVIQLFQGSEDEISMEDQLISFLQEAAQECGFTVDSVNVERQRLKPGEKLPVLRVAVKGVGSFNTIERYLNEVAQAEYLLSEEAIRLSRARDQAMDHYSAEIIFERLLVSGWQ